MYSLNGKATGQLCCFDLEKTYGEIGKGYIHVRHIKLLASIGNSYQVNPIDDLRPVRPDCHAMLHQQTSPLTIDELKQIMEKWHRNDHGQRTLMDTLTPSSR